MTVLPRTRDERLIDHAEEIIRKAAATLGIAPPEIESDGLIYWVRGGDMFEIDNALTAADPKWRHYMNWVP